MTPPAATASRERLSQTLSALANPVRLRLLATLAATDELDVGTLAAQLGLPVANVSHHLVRLRAAGVVVSERVGTRIVNRLDPSLFLTLDELTVLLAGTWDDATGP